MADPIAPGILAADPRFAPLAEATRRLERLPLDGLLTYLIDTAPESYLDELIRQFHIAGLEGGMYAATSAERRRLIRDAIALHGKKGTPWAVRHALTMAGHAVVRVEDATRPAHRTRWAEYQLELAGPVHGEALTTILDVARLAAPARSHLVRLYGGYDRRILHASTGDRWSDAFLSDDSGVWVDGVMLSFGRAKRLAAHRQTTSCAMQRRRLHAARALYPDVLRYGTARFGDAPVLNHPVARGRQTGLGNAHGLLHPVILAGNPPPKRWTGGWDARTWGHRFPMTPHRRIARAAFVLSDDWRLGEPNTRFGGVAETAEGRFFWSDPDSKLSAFDPGRVRATIEEVWVVNHGLAAVAPANLGQVGGSVSRHVLHASRAVWHGQVRIETAMSRLHASRAAGIGDRASRYPWAGGWDVRRWGGDIALVHQTLTS